MKRTALFTVLFLLVPLLAQGQVIEKDGIDEPTEKRVVITTITDVPVLQSTRATSVWESKARLSYVDGSYFLMFRTVSNGWIFQGDDSAYFAAGRELHRTNVHQVSRNPLEKGGVTEFIAVSIGPDLRSVLDGARKARVDIGEHTFDISPVVDDEIREVERRVKQ